MKEGIEDRIVEIVASVYRELEGRGLGDGYWTAQLNAAFAEAGRKLNKYVCVQGTAGAQHGEWLYDISWLCFGDRQDPKKEHLQSVDLAVEIEWARNLGDIRDDFQKLLQSKAALRAFVTQEPKVGAVDDVLREVCDGIASFDGSVDGDRYLLFVYCWQPRALQCWSISSKGAGSRPILRQIPARENDRT